MITYATFRLATCFYLVKLLPFKRHKCFITVNIGSWYVESPAEIVCTLRWKTGLVKTLIYAEGFITALWQALHLQVILVTASIKGKKQIKPEHSVDGIFNVIWFRYTYETVESLIKRFVKTNLVWLITTLIVASKYST